MLYFDTSFLVPMLIAEETSDKVEAFLLALSPEEDLAVSHWTRVEFASVLARLVRMQQLGRQDAGEISNCFDAFLEQSFIILTPTLADYQHGWSFLTRFDNSLRGGDALHLAIANNRNCEEFYTLDAGLQQAGALLDIPVTRGIT
jgi:predicted nucleic acid-binding protein